MGEAVIRDDGLEIATEAFGDPTHPAVLLIMGGGASMLWWPRDFCARLAGHGRYVIRYDQRDTGLTRDTPRDAPYTLGDLIDDALRVLDGYALPTAHIVGMSLGGMIGQYAALKQSARVRSLTVISSSPVGIDTSHLPQFGEAYREHLDAADAIDWSDRDQAIAYMVEESRITAGTAHPFVEAQVREFVERDFDRTGGYPSTSNLSWTGVEEWQGRLQEMKAPLLVIHGTADPVYPIEHGVALSQAVGAAKLIRLEGGGHELHPADWDTIVGAIVEHTRAT